MIRRASEGVERLARRLGRVRVEETAACARALTALIGREPVGETLPGGSAQATRALLTDRVMRATDPVPWPAALMRQLDPDDPAFLPPLGLHPVLAGRDRTLLGLPDSGPGSGGLAWVDPLGWCGVGEGPSVAVWFGLEDEPGAAWPVGRRPDEPSGIHGRRQQDGTRDPAFEVLQEWSDERVGIRTVCRRGSLKLSLMHWPVRLEGQVAWALYAKLELAGRSARPGRLAFALRPATLEGVAPIFHLSRDGDGLWSADGTPLLALSRTGDGLLASAWGQPDPWHRFAGPVPGTGLSRLGRVDVRCPVGQASAAEIYTPLLEPGHPFTRLAVVAPPRGTPAALVRTSGHSLWAGASADRRGLLRAGCDIVLSEHQLVFEAGRLRLLHEPEHLDVAACLGAVALARMGFSRRAEDRVARWLDRVRRDGRLPAGDGVELGAVLAWTAAEIARWTGNTGWVRDQLAPWRCLVERLAGDEPTGPGGHALLGREGSIRWTAIWRTAALLGSSVALREQAPEHTDWAIAGGRLREALPRILGKAPWTVAEGRATDGAAAGLMAACWLGVLRPDHPDAVATALHLREHHWHGGGVLLHGGAHPAATTLLVAVLARLDPTLDPLGILAHLASPVGALPTARHPARGAIGEGDDLLSAALFALLALERVQVERGRIRLLPGLRSARDLPTPYGRIDIEPGADGRPRVIGRWWEEAPEIEVVESTTR